MRGFKPSRQVPAPVFVGSMSLSLLRELLLHRLTVGRVARSVGVGTADAQPWARQHKRLFVLGSGGSVSTYGEDELRTLEREGDSLALGFWLVHDHVPTALMLEVPEHEERKRILLELLSLRAEDYDHVPILFRFGYYRRRWVEEFIREMPSRLRRNVVLTRELTIPGRTTAEVERSIGYLARPSARRMLRRLSVLLRARASLSVATMLGAQMGYEEIVLCGVDLNDASYFYEKDKTKYEAKGRPVPSTGMSDEVHLTVDAEVGIPIDQILYALDELMLRPKGVRLYTANPRSLLAPRVPVFDLAGGAPAGEGAA